MTRVLVAGTDETVTRKEPLGPDASVRLRHELPILERLRGVAGVCQLATVPARLGSILLVEAPEQTGRTGRPVDQRADLYGFRRVHRIVGRSRAGLGTGDL